VDFDRAGMAAGKKVAAAIGGNNGMASGAEGLLCLCLAGFAWGAAGAGNRLWPRSLGCRLHSRVPVKKATATVACEKFALAELVPGLRANAHPAASALLVLSASDSGAA